MVAYNFQKQFVPLILSGQKRQTVRRISNKRHARPGEIIQLYTGQRTKECKKIMDAVCTNVLPIMIHDGVVIVAGNLLQDEALLSFVKADGFKSVKEFLRFFEQYPNPFHGVVIKWDPNLQP